MPSSHPVVARRVPWFCAAFLALASACTDSGTSGPSGSSGQASSSGASSSSAGASSLPSSRGPGSSSAGSGSSSRAGASTSVDLPPECRPYDGGPVPGPPVRTADGGWAWPAPATADDIQGCAHVGADLNPTHTVDTTPPSDPVPQVQCVGCCDDGIRSQACADAPHPAPLGTRGRPTSPFPATIPTVPGSGMPCQDGMGWDFEDGSGTHQGWTPTGVFGNAIPVYGNNVSIFRLRPPGMSEAAAQRAVDGVGGDFWEFSRDVNQNGDYWLGSSDIRRDWTVPAGGRAPDTEAGTLTSPYFQVAAATLWFRVGGVRHAGQRVELWVLPNGQGDVPNLYAAYEGLDTEGLPFDGTAPGPAEELDGAVRVRTATARQTGEWMGTTVAWNLSPFMGRTAYLRVVDEASLACAEQAPNGGCLVYVPQHINVDAFTCATTPPPTTPVQNCTPNGCFESTTVSVNVRPQPLWGTTESHAHPAANTHFGGHMFWGDTTDSLQTLYDCTDPAVPAPHGHGAESRPPYAQHGCGVDVGWVVAVATELFSLVCVPLASVPVAGWGLAAACAVSLTALGVAASFGVMSGRTYHGASALTSGGLTLLEWLGFLTGNLGVENISGVVEGLDWDRNRKHTGKGLSRLHNAYQYQMLERAWQGGLRLMVADAENGRLLQELLDRRSDYSDWDAIADLVSTMQRLTDPVTGPARHFAEIALSPSQARDIIARDKLAIIMGTEVQELGKARFAGDSVERQVQDLHALGIRKITPIHGINNPLGGTAIFNDVYNSNNLYANGTLSPSGVKGRPTRGWSPVPIPIFLPPFLPPPFSFIPIAVTPLLFVLTERTPEPEEPTVSWGSHFVVEDGSVAQDWIGGGITYRAGMENTHKHLSSVTGSGTLYPEATRVNLAEKTPLMHANWVDPALNWIVGGTSDACELGDMLVPLDRPVPPAIQATYVAASQGHRNVEGLSLKGEAFVKEMMRHGMILDVDHMSQRARVKAFELASARAYPLHAIHVNVRPYEKNGVVVIEQAHQHGSVTELSKPRQEVEAIVGSGGTASPAMWGSFMDPVALSAAGDAPSEVLNDCDFSSKSLAVKYLVLMRWQQGRGLTPSTDMGLAAPVVPRFGVGACHQRAGDGLEDWRRDWTLQEVPGNPGQAIRERCWNNMEPASGGVARARADGPQDPLCPSTTMLRDQESEYSGIWYEDYVTLAADPSRGRTGLSNASDPSQVEVLVRTGDEWRDDRSEQAPWPQKVYSSPALQQRAMKKMKTTGAFPAGDARNTGWDYNLDGLAHIGLYPDLFQDIHNVGVSFEQMTPLFNAAEEYIRMWERACVSASAGRPASELPLPGCG